MRSEPLYNISEVYRVSNREYKLLHESFDKYAKWAAWHLMKKNTKNSHTNEWEDIYQEAIWAVVKAACYYKRQVYIEKCFVVLEKHINKKSSRKALENLKNLWENRKRHGANKQKFGKIQETILDKLVYKFVPKEEHPSKLDDIVINQEFAGYCKSIVLNTLKSIGKSITKEKPIRDIQISIDSFDSFDYSIVS